jgi:hypothetical protein
MAGPDGGRRLGRNQLWWRGVKVLTGDITLLAIHELNLAVTK